MDNFDFEVHDCIVIGAGWYIDEQTDTFNSYLTLRLVWHCRNERTAGHSSRATIGDSRVGVLHWWSLELGFCYPGPY
jgi:hypothetical protein